MGVALKSALCAASMLASLTISASAAAQEVDYTPPADEMVEAMAIMDSMFPADTREEMMLGIVETMGRQVAEGMMSGPIFEEPGIRAIMDKFLDNLPNAMRPSISKYLPRMIKATAIAYTREFTLKELQDIREFAETPSGQRYFASAQAVMSDPAIAAVNQEFFAEIAELQTEQGQLLREELMEFLNANPDVVLRLHDAGVGRE